MCESAPWHSIGKTIPQEPLCVRVPLGASIGKTIPQEPCHREDRPSAEASGPPLSSRPLVAPAYGSGRQCAHTDPLLLCLVVVSHGSQLLPPPPASCMASVSPAVLCVLGASQVNKLHQSGNTAVRTVMGGLGIINT